MDINTKLLQHVSSEACRKLDISSPFSWRDLPPSKWLPAARVEVLSMDEIFTLKDDFPFSLVNPRNEAAALSSLLSKADEVCGNNTELRDQLVALCNEYADVEVQLGLQSTTGQQHFPESTPEAELLRWAKEQGCQVHASIATFDGLRGLAADEDIPAGGTVLCIPSSLIITAQTAWDSDLGRVLSRIPGLSEDMASLLWTLVERHDAESRFKHFWDCLPAAFNTGLSAPESAVAVLEGSPAMMELLQARGHLQEQYEAVQPVLAALLRAYRDLLQPDWFTWERFVWAAELWYAYAIQVEFPGVEAAVSGLVPVASLMNHSCAPHIVRFSVVDEQSQQLRLRTFRTCPKGRQCFLSYGPLPNAHLLLFYGFALQQNPFDVFPLSFQVGEDDPLADRKSQLLQRLLIPLDHNLHPPPAPLHPRLLDCLRVVVADEQALQAMEAVSWQGGVAEAENEEAAWEALLSTLEGLLQPFQSFKFESINEDLGQREEQEGQGGAQLQQVKRQAHEGKADEGKADEGKADEGKADEDKLDEDKLDEDKLDEDKLEEHQGEGQHEECGRSEQQEQRSEQQEPQDEREQAAKQGPDDKRPGQVNAAAGLSQQGPFATAARTYMQGQAAILRHAHTLCKVEMHTPRLRQ